MARYRVVYERDESGAWVARVPSVRGCHTHGRTIEQARRRIREALGLWVASADTAELIDDVRLPRRAEAALERALEARRAADVSREEAQTATERTVRLLVEELRLGLRDTGDLLGLTRQRIQQIVRS